MFDIHTYNDLIENNDHSEAAVYLATFYGSPIEIEVLTMIRDKHEAQGEIYEDQAKLRREISNRHFALMVSGPVPISI